MTEATERKLQQEARREELTLLANWSMNKHREDIAVFDGSLFSRKKMYKAVLEGKNPVDLMKEGLLEDSSVTELMSIATADFGDAEYTEARTSVLLKLRSKYAQQIGVCNQEETADLIAKINEIEAALSGEDFKPLAANYGDNYIKELEQIQAEENPQYGTGFKWLDHYSKGLHRGELTIIGARPRIGKSAISLQIAYNVAVMQGYKVLFLPLEMTVNSCLERILLQAQMVEPDFKENCTEKDKADIKTFLDGLEDNLKFCSALNRIEDIERVIKAEQPYLIIVDQLSQVKIAGRRKDLREQYVEITRALKRIALEQNVAIITLSQINRENADRDRPSLEALAESDSIGQDADNVFILQAEREDEEEEAVARMTYLHIVKQRNGASGLKVPLIYHGERFTFSPVDLNNKY